MEADRIVAPALALLLADTQAFTAQVYVVDSGLSVFVNSDG